MLVCTLIENNTCRTDLRAEHGLSLYIEACGRKILFDMGQSDGFLENARILGIDPKQVELAVLSHGHYDHAGGLSAFLAANSTAPVYMNRHVPEPHHNAADKYIGIDLAAAKDPRICYTGDRHPLGPGLCLYTCNGQPRPYPTDTCGLTVLEDDRLVPEDFRHEQYLLVEEAGKRILISGCSHKGILNIMHWFSPHILIGGFHFMKTPADSPLLAETAEALLKYDCTYYTCHCTGSAQFDRMKAIMGHRLNAIETGSLLAI